MRPKNRPSAPSIPKSTSPSREDDCIELFIDTRNDGGVKLNDNDFQLTLGLNNNMNQMRGSDRLGQTGIQVPRGKVSNIDCRLYVRPLGTLNRNQDLDTGYIVEAALSFRSLGINPFSQSTIRFDVVNVDRDGKHIDRTTGALVDNESEFIFCDKESMKSPDLWALLSFHNPPLKELVGGRSIDQEPPDLLKISLTLLLIFILALTLILAAVYVKTRRLLNQINSEIVVKLKRYIQENYTSDISANDFSDQYKIPVTKVHSAIKNQVKSTFSNMVLMKRLNAAKDLLETSDESVTDIGLAVGFNDPSYFSKMFRKQFGCSPKDVRKHD